MADCSQLDTLFTREHTHVLSDIFVEHLSREGSREEEEEKEREKVVTQKCWPRLYLFAGLLKLDEARRR